MRNKRGDGYIPTCVMIIILCMLLSIFVTFISAVNIVKQTKRNSRAVLDSFVMKQSIIIYDSIKNGNDELPELDLQEYITELSEYCTFERKNHLLYNYNSDGDIQYYISEPTLGFSKEKELKVYAEYSVYIPLYFAGIRVDTVGIPITVTADFTEKF